MTSQAPTFARGVGSVMFLTFPKCVCFWFVEGFPNIHCFFIFSVCVINFLATVELAFQADWVVFIKTLNATST